MVQENGWEDASKSPNVSNFAKASAEPSLLELCRAQAKSHK